MPTPQVGGHVQAETMWVLRSGVRDHEGVGKWGGWAAVGPLKSPSGMVFIPCRGCTWELVVLLGGLCWGCAIAALPLGSGDGVLCQHISWLPWCIAGTCWSSSWLASYALPAIPQGLGCLSSWKRNMYETYVLTLESIYFFMLLKQIFFFLVMEVWMHDAFFFVINCFL